MLSSCSGANMTLVDINLKSVNLCSFHANDYTFEEHVNNNKLFTSVTSILQSDNC